MQLMVIILTSSKMIDLFNRYFYLKDYTTALFLVFNLCTTAISSPVSFFPKVLDGVVAAGGSAEAVASLNSAMLDITQLYEEFAEPFQLWECKLAIVACAGHSEPQLVQVCVCVGGRGV